MTERKWSSGPWVSLDKGCGDLRVVDALGYEIAEISTAEASSDAHLIAAAPDLYEALDEIDKWSIRQNIALPSTCIYKALSKARGQTNA